MSADRDRIRRLVLSYEELDAEERAEADALLAASPAHREILERLQAAERSEGPIGEMPPLDVLLDAMDAETREGADRSLDALRARVGARVRTDAEGAPARRTERRGLLSRLWGVIFPRRWPGRLVLAAAAATAALLLMWGRVGQESPFLALEIRDPAGERGAATSRPPGAPWRTGDAFAIWMELEAPAQIVIVNADPSGGLTILYPPAPPASPLPGGRPLEIPPPASGETWRLEGPPGEESFLVTAASELPAGAFEALTRDIAHLATRPIPRAERIDRALELLEHLGPTRRIDLTHAP